ncbi:hypothetical protein HQ529_06585 [Candidatus Woesearchaeota archaeon]|nr:hypothetical protein [Candidatus Woesearchaeota archaeon]
MKIFAHKRGSQKKGSLSLSVNAIVVLILAITMLGLGLGFMKGMFAKVSSQVESAISATELENPATADRPMTMSAKDINLKRGESFRLDLGYFNAYASDADSVQVNVVGCSHFDTTTPGTKSVNINEQEAFSVLIEAPSNATSETSVCTFEISSTYVDETNTTESLGTLSKELFIKVP